MKCHKWTTDDELQLLNAIDECEPLFEHFKNQGNSYSEMNVWDAIAGRMLPITLTGAACKRHYEIITTRELESETGAGEKTTNAWEKTAEMVEQYEYDLAESTHDTVNNLFTAITKLTDVVESLQKEVRDLNEVWK